MEGKGLVCVTGGTGYVASWLIKKLLEKGCTVRTTVRSSTAGNKKDLSYLPNLPGAVERLHIFNADLSDPDSFGLAIKGCVGVFHMAHPIDYTMGSPEETITQIAVGGLLGIVTACLSAKTVKRVVYTATAGAVLFHGKDLGVADEGTWSDLEVCRKSPLYPNYLVSKTLTEKVALEFGEWNGLEVVTCAPPTVIGPFISPFVPECVETALGLVAGNLQWDKLLPMGYFVHTDDLTRAHIFLMESPNVKGRYICRALELRSRELVEFLSNRYPAFNITIPDKMKELKDQKATSMSSKKLLDAGFEYKYGLEEIFDDLIRCSRALGRFGLKFGEEGNV